MKIQLVLALLIFTFLSVKGQTAKSEPKSGVIVYSKGAMYVAPKKDASDVYNGKSSDYTSMYIGGSAKFTTGSSITQQGRTEIIGDFVNAKNPAYTSDTDYPQLFTGTQSSQMTGVVAFVGKQTEVSGVLKNTRQWIYGVDTDWTTSTAWSLDDQKTINYINFPTIVIDKGVPGDTDDWREVSLVSVDPTASVSIDYLDVNTTDKNRLEVKTDFTEDKTKIRVGYLDIKNLSSYMLADPVAVSTYSQLDWRLYNYEAGVIDDGAFLDETVERPYIDPATWEDSGRGTLRTSKNGLGWNYLVGFTPPFKELGADYMFYHVLTKPAATSITSWDGPIVDPFFRMQNGRGYFMSMEVSHADHKDNIDVRWNFDGTGTGIFNTRRARGGYVFNRMVFHDHLSVPNAGLSSSEGAQNNFSRFLYDNTTTTLFDDKYTVNSAHVTDAVHGLASRPLGGYYVNGMSTSVPNLVENGKDRSRYELMEDETFQLSDVQVQLTAGLNFLGNPFMTPISLNPLLGLNMDGTVDIEDANTGGSGDLESGFDVSSYFGSGITASTVDPSANLRSKYWIINQALVRYDNDDNVFRYLVTYDYVSRSGATAVTGTVDAGSSTTEIGTGVTNPETYLIAPMQMFCLQASSDISITLSKDLRKLGTSRIPKSSSDNSSLKRDWFVVEASNSESNGTVSDRMSVTFRDDASSNFNITTAETDPYDTRKGLTKEFEEYEQEITDLNGFTTKTKQEIPTNIVYTKSNDGISLLGNAVPTKTKEMSLYFNAPEQSQDVKLRFYGIENIESVPGVWLVDRVLNTITEVDSDTEYTFVSNPSDTKSLTGDNRFVLRFYPSEDDDNVDDSTPITCYYNSSTLYLSGLNDNDTNSDLMIYDMQGRLMGRTKVIVNGSGKMEYVKPLGLGTYIAKIAGKRNFTAKFANLK